jgi:hypothetical protein
MYTNEGRDGPNVAGLGLKSMLDSVWLGGDSDSERYIYWLVVPVSLYIAWWILFGGGRLLYSHKGFGATHHKVYFNRVAASLSVRRVYYHVIRLVSTRANTV